MSRRHVAKGIGRMARPVMSIIVPEVLLLSSNSARYKGIIGHEAGLPSQFDQGLDARATGTNVSNLGIMRQPIGTLLVSLN